MSTMWMGKNVCSRCYHLGYCQDKDTCEAYEVLKRLIRSGTVSTKDVEKVIAEEGGPNSDILPLDELVFGRKSSKKVRRGWRTSR